MMKIKSRTSLALVLLVASAFAKSNGTNVTIDLGTATNFALLAGSGITNASAATRIIGDVGSSPTPTVTGLTQSQVHGTLYTQSDPATAQAQVDLTVGYNEAAGASCGTDLTGTDLGGLTLVPGVYCFSSSALLTGTLTLDGQGDANAQWVFQIGSTLTTATNATVSLINGAVNCNVFWQIGSSATIQTNNTFVGNIMALTSITLDGGILNGRALARNGAVTITSKEFVHSNPCTCNVMVSSSSAGTVTNISFPMPYVPGQSTETIIATGRTSAEGLACGPDRRLYLAQSGVLGGPMQIVRLDQNGQNQKTVVDFSKVPGLAASGGPKGVSFVPFAPNHYGPVPLFFSTTLAQGLSNTGVWKSPLSLPVQSVLPFPPNGNSNGGGATAFLTTGPFAGKSPGSGRSKRQGGSRFPSVWCGPGGNRFHNNPSNRAGRTSNQQGRKCLCKQYRWNHPAVWAGWNFIRPVCDNGSAQHERYLRSHRTGLSSSHSKRSSDHGPARWNSGNPWYRRRR